MYKEKKRNVSGCLELRNEKVRVNREREEDRSKIKLTEEFVRRSWGRD